MQEKNKADIYDIIQARLLKRLDDAIASGENFRWVKPWDGGAPYPCSYSNPDRPFNFFMNALFLDPGEYLTYNKIRELHKGNPEVKIRKGAKQELVFQYFPVFRKNRDGGFTLDENGEKILERYALRYSREYGIWDVEGLNSHFTKKEYQHTFTEDMLIADRVIENYCRGQGIDLEVRKGANQAYYCNGAVKLPDKSQFSNIYEYYSTVFHELGHSTMEMTGRKEKKFTYAQEELAAEVTAATMCSYLHISDEKAEGNNIAYLLGWRERLKEEKPFGIVRAVEEAKKACNGICQYSRKLIKVPDAGIEKQAAVKKAAIKQTGRKL